VPKTPDDIEGGITDAGKVIYRDEGLTADAEGESVYRSGAFSLRDSIGVFNPRNAGTVAFRKNARLQCPITRQNASNSWSEVGNIFWDYSEYGAATVLRWTGMVYRNTASLSIRAVLESTGAELGTVTVTTGNYQSATFNLTGLPAADDAVVVQIKRNSGSGGTVVAGQFEFLES
jgi:hypothetical protein